MCLDCARLYHSEQDKQIHVVMGFTEEPHQGD